MRLKNYIINSIWDAGTRRDYTRFMSGCADAGKIQENYLLEMIRNHAGTSFGIENGFENIRTVSQFRDRVPIRTYEDFQPWIDRIIKGEKSVLTSEDVILFEPTGGSSGGTKLIPYTKSLRREFLFGINPWIYDLYRNYPSIKNGVSYWSISPQEKSLPKTPGGIPVGFDDDTDYLGWVGRLINGVMAVDNSVRRVGSIDEFWNRTARKLLLHEDLALISVWSPTFLIRLIGFIDENIGQLILRVSEIDSRRGDYIKNVFLSEFEDRYRAIWPGLAVISCWTDAQAGLHIEKIRQLFPQASIQGKGLLATEGLISFPLVDAGGCVPAYRSHFVEFKDCIDGLIRLVNEVEVGRRYRVVVTTGGGLYRYDLGDIVSVTGKYRGLPVIKFDGRNQVSDLVGEKLSETHVRSAVESAIANSCNGCVFAMLSPERDRSRYILYVEMKTIDGQDKAVRLRDCVEKLLRENFHYDHARELGQLGNLECRLVTGNAYEIYEERCRSEGQKIGDIKGNYLDMRSGWLDWFAGNGFAD
jgi:hypothetical protein